MVELSYAFFKRMLHFGQCIGINYAKSESEDILHFNVLKSCKGNIPGQNSLSYGNYWKIREENIEKHPMYYPYSDKID